MGSKINCTCCGKRISGDSKRHVTIRSLRIFVSVRLFPSGIPDDCFICDACRWMYKKWAADVDLREILSQIDASNEDDDRLNKETDETSSGSDSNNSDDKHVK